MEIHKTDAPGTVVVTGKMDETVARKWHWVQKCIFEVYKNGRHVCRPFELVDKLKT